MKLRVKVTVEKDWRGELVKLAESGNIGVKAGVLSGETVPDSGKSVAEYAFYNEFGTRHIPARPFLRQTVTNKGKEWARLFALQVRGSSLTPEVMKRAFGLLGEQMQGDVVAQIKSGMPPENAESTKRRKQKTVSTRGGGKKGTYTPGTLIDTGLLVNSIRYEVTDDGA